MKKQLFIFLLLLFFFSSVSAQEKEAKLFSEFGNTTCNNYRGLMDNFLLELKNFPEAKGYAFIYEGDLELYQYDKNGKNKGLKTFTSVKGYSKEVIDYYQKHLLFREFPAERIEFIEAGFREKFTIELWIVPNEAIVPKPTPTLEKIKQRKPTRTQFGFCGEM